MKMAFLIIAWAAWFVLHSALASHWFSRYLKKRHRLLHRYHRVFYNAFAIVSLVPVLLITHSFEREPVFRWDGWMRLAQIAIAGVALSLFAAGGRRFDLLQFLGVRQVGKENDCAVLTDDCSLDTSGVLGMIRHPWYTGGMLIVWARNMDETAVIVNLLICMYFIVGAYLEEKKLIADYGDEYRDYRRKVSMFVPMRLLRRYLSGRSAF